MVRTSRSGSSLTFTTSSSCSRIIRRSKYEQNDPSVRLWWNNVFVQLEEEAAILPHERRDVIEKMFPHLQERLKQILSFKDCRKDEPVEPAPAPAITYKKSTFKSKFRASTVAGSKASVITDYTEFPRHAKPNNAKPNNPFRRFFKTRIDRAAVWKDLPPLELHEMNLTQKAEAITRNISSRFYAWLKEVGGNGGPTLDTDTIMKMFEIGFNYHAAQSLCVQVKEMPAVTDTIADARHLEEASLRYNLHRQLQKDLKAFKTKEKQIAFGKMLPLELRSMPPKEDFAKKWLHCKRVPKDLASMQAVWGGIENLRSTRAFCAWLINHPEIPPPAYLVDKGMLNPHYIQGPHYSAEDFGDNLTEFGAPQ